MSWLRSIRRVSIPGHIRFDGPCSEDERSENERSPADGKAGTEGVAAARPDPEVVAKAKRRRFTADYKQQILAKADTAAEHGGIGACCVARGCTRRI